MVRRRCKMAAAARGGTFALPDAGRNVDSTSHVDNVVEFLILAADKGRGGDVYYVPDGTSNMLNSVLSALLGSRGIRSAPFGVARCLATVLEGVWRLLAIRSKPPITRQTLRMIGRDFTLDTTKARRDLGYVPVITGDEGIALMSAQRA